uniref:Uncharacterized protein n=1 Tax=Rhizobium leguminosarum TaxID=384 RepID=A0A179BTT2_RHILE|nr:hypothetical protein A4U53_17905 [Rhizobium leguminosarum]
MNCKRCDIDCIARGPAQKYCLDCAAIVQKENVKLWGLGNAESERERNARQRESDPVRHASYGRKWRLANRDKVNAAYNARMADPKKRLDKAISRSIAACLSGAKDGRTWESLVGYSLGELTRHLEKLFLPGMTWENYGDWHVDHVIPKSIFNYSRPEHLDFSRAWSLKNLQPLWATDNHKKSNKFGSQFQPSLALEC